MSLEELRWKKFPLLSDGFICLVDTMGDESAVVQAARVSYGEGTKNVSDDVTLLRYLMRMTHSTPYEMIELKFLLRCPIYVARQLMRSRTWSFNEYSGRYSVMIDSMDKTPENKWRTQSETNKQGSGGYIERGLGYVLTCKEAELHQELRDVYEDRLSVGVAREQARKDLPVSNYTEMYAKVDLHNLMHFLRLRMDSHAQEEIRAYADVIGKEIVAKLYPNIWQAFVDYRLESLQLTRLDVLFINKMMLGLTKESATAEVGWPVESRCRERDECYSKCTLLGIL